MGWQVNEGATRAAGVAVETERGAGPGAPQLGIDDPTHHVVALIGDGTAAQAAVAALRRAGWDGSDIHHRSGARGPHGQHWLLAHVLVVYAPSAYQVRRAHLILSGHGAWGMRHYGSAGITDLPVIRRGAGG